MSEENSIIEDDPNQDNGEINSLDNIELKVEENNTGDTNIYSAAYNNASNNQDNINDLPIKNLDTDILISDSLQQDPLDPLIEPNQVNTNARPQDKLHTYADDIKKNDGNDNVLLTSIENSMAPPDLKNHHELNLSENDYINNKEESITFELDINIQADIPQTKKKGKNSLNDSFQTFEPKRNKPQPSPFTQDTVYYHSHEELESAFSNMLKNKKVPSQDIVSDLITYAKEKNMDAILKEQYDTASKIDEIVKILVQSLSADYSSVKNLKGKNEINDRIESIKNHRNYIIDSYKSKIDNRKEDLQRRINQLEKDHQRQLEEFELSWSTPEAMQSYSKPSQRLLVLRNAQKQLGLAHQFEEAKATKAIADSLQLQETEEAKKRAIEAMRIEYMQLLDRQQKEMECLKLNHYRKIKNVEVEFEKELSANDNAKRFLNSRISPTKPKPQVTIPVIDYKLHGPSAVKPNHSSKIRNIEQTKLDVKLDDFKLIVHPKKK